MLIQVLELGQRDARNIVSSGAEKRNPKLTPPQKDLLLRTFRKCPTPLFLKVSTRSSAKVQQLENEENTCRKIK
ncbi:hypothetical protein DPMN_156907 [Dreissena polymorpha]|uniref:Uncharacterized protein n=1 Tax=Dreissena polymorpha TaxID=45954 RepID=A0A9D4FS15_DREPO|nr:hypothetical protein DPMN_156907 [Dreissena polymorpha]